MLGNLLKNKREELKLSLEDVEKNTNIRKLYIIALENEDFEKLPKADVFIKGFIKSYGKFINLDEKTLIAAYMEDKEKKNDNVITEVVEEIPKENKENITTKKEDNVKRTSINDFENHQKYMIKKEPNKFKILSIIGSIIVILFILIGGISYLSSTKEEVKDTPIAQTQVEEKPLMPIRISLEAVADDYLVVSVDGVEVFNKEIKQGEKLDFEGKEKLTIKGENPKDISLKINDENSRLLADTTQEATLEIFLKDGKIETNLIQTTNKVESKETIEPKKEVKKADKQDTKKDTKVKAEEKGKTKSKTEEVKQEIKKETPNKEVASSETEEVKATN